MIVGEDWFSAPSCFLWMPRRPSGVYPALPVKWASFCMCVSNKRSPTTWGLYQRTSDFWKPLNPHRNPFGHYQPLCSLSLLRSPRR